MAEQLEPVKKREEEFRAEILTRDGLIERQRLAMEELKADLEEVKRKLNDESSQNNKMVDLRLDFEAKIDKKEIEIHRLKEEVVKQRDEIRGKDEAIKALTMTLLEKGKDNQKLSEMIIEIKNH